MFRINKVKFVIFVILFSSSVLASNYSKDVYTLKKKLNEIGVKLSVDKFFSDVRKVNVLSTIILKHLESIKNVGVKEIDVSNINAIRFSPSFTISPEKDTFEIGIDAKHDVLGEKAIIKIIKISSIIAENIPLMRKGNLGLDLHNLEDESVLESLRANLFRVIVRASKDKMGAVALSKASEISPISYYTGSLLYLKYKDILLFISNGKSAFPSSDALADKK